MSPPRKKQSQTSVEAPEVTKPKEGVRNTIEWAMRPVHYSMALVGLHFTVDRSKPVSTAVFVIYYCVILATNLYDLLRYFGTYEYGMAFGPTLVMKICAHVFYLSIIMGAIVQFKYSIGKGKIMHTWQEYIDRYKVKMGLVIALRRKCIVITCIGWTMISACVIATSYELHRKESIIEALFAYSIPINTPFRIAMFVIHHFYSSSVLSFSVFHLIALCSGLSQEFHEIHDDLIRKKDPEGGLKVSLEFFRQRHRKLTEVVSQVDDIFAVYNLFSIVVNVGMSCLTLYSLFTVRTDHPERYISIAAIFIFYMTIFLIIPLSISFAGVYLHQSAFVSISTLYNLDLSKCQWDDLEIAQYTTFLDNLRDCNVGITGWKFFLITKMTVKTIFIMLVTYTVILLKFGNNEYESDLFGLHLPNETESVTTSVPPL